MKQEKQNPFIKYNGIKDAKVHIHKTSGLYDASNEHDACGVGMIVDIHGNKSHELVDSALKVLENMKHRGAEGADNKTGDGAGSRFPMSSSSCKASPYRKKENTARDLSSYPRTSRSNRTC